MKRVLNLKQLRLGVLASVVVLLCATPLAQAGEGHDHGDGGAAPSANGPQRLPDGSVFLPKPAQRQLGVRTLTTADAELPRSVELTGKVLMGGNLIDALEDGDAAYPAMLAAIAGAQRSITLATYIFDNDAAGQAFLLALCGARERGVEVRVLIDGLDTRAAPRRSSSQRRTLE